MGSVNGFNGEITVGPFGGEEGNSYSFRAKTAVKQITVMHSSVSIESVSFKGDTECSGKIGGGYDRVTRADEIYVDFPSEYLTGVSGTIGKQDGYEVVKSLRFYTNLTEYGPFGFETGTAFSFRQEGGAIVGFHGLSGWLVVSIGVYVSPLSSSSDTTANMKNPDLAGGRVPAGSPGPWGGNQGRVFDDGVFAKVKQIHVHLCGASNAVSAVQFEYWKKDRTAVWSPIHGSPAGNLVKKIVLGEDESILAIEGFYGPIEGITSGFSVIRSLTFHTNVGKYGPLGGEIGTFFDSCSCRGKVVGFYGRSGQYLEAIGVHTETAFSINCIFSLVN